MVRRMSVKFWYLRENLYPTLTQVLLEIFLDDVDSSRTVSTKLFSSHKFAKILNTHCTPWGDLRLQVWGNPWWLGFARALLVFSSARKAVWIRVSAERSNLIRAVFLIACTALTFIHQLLNQTLTRGAGDNRVICQTNKKLKRTRQSARWCSTPLCFSAPVHPQKIRAKPLHAEHNSRPFLNVLSNPISTTSHRTTNKFFRSFAVTLIEIVGWLAGTPILRTAEGSFAYETLLNKKPLRATSSFQHTKQNSEASCSFKTNWIFYRATHVFFSAKFQKVPQN